MSGRALDGSWLYVEIYAICVSFLFLTLYWTVKSREGSVQLSWYKRTVKAFIIAFCMNCAWALIRTAGQDTFITLQYVFKSGFYLFVDIGVMAYCGYAESEQGRSLLFSKSNALICLLPLMLMVMIPISTYWTGYCFTISPDGDYCNGSLFVINFGVLAAYAMFFGGRLLIRSRYEVERAAKKHMIRIGMFSVVFCAVWILLIPFPQFPFICFGVTYMLMVIYIGNSSDLILVDKLTKVNNRQNLMSYIERKIHSSAGGIQLLMMDVDHFKIINDTYGHLEGDNALVCLANALKTACKECDRHVYLARYGGDEFIAVLEAASREDAERFAELISEKVRYYNAWATVPYALTATIGIASYEEGMSGNDLIKKADDDLYLKKKTRL